MDLQNNNKIKGLVEGVQYGQFERVDELNSRLTSRQFSDSPLEPNFDIRPVSTKYSHFPILDRRSPSTGSSQSYTNYRLSTNFNPGTDNAPVSGYFSNIDLETNLRNQHFALQHGAPQGVYIPTSESELYKVHVTPTIGEHQPHPELFNKPSFDTSVHPNLSNSRIGNDSFFNHTRTQLRNNL
jgi:hypothetical protein